MANRTELTVEVVGASVGNKMMVAGGGAGVFAWLASLNWLGLTGAAVAVIGLVANLYFQHRRDKREQAERDAEKARNDRREAREEAEHAVRMAALRERCELP